MSSGHQRMPILVSVNKTGFLTFVDFKWQNFKMLAEIEFGVNMTWFSAFFLIDHVLGYWLMPTNTFFHSFSVKKHDFLFGIQN